ncbi:hypothetical protein DUNSADRAFT_12839 [Dunaliella salina]|uniref:Encoded protein n=1 Tax=Dunaliella salina TaxID=3046 RepID=A0ABQ7H9P3_DUNSA|nr:hypothetical protein DUNSADRAFT_12839 [Dunaliella salina]|eukprot:KAF5843577.1 hypothetical protein DUNSADRAFT_12839 [Dunaliella salina]
MMKVCMRDALAERICVDSACKSGRSGVDERIALCHACMRAGTAWTITKQVIYTICTQGAKVRWMREVHFTMQVLVEHDIEYIGEEWDAREKSTYRASAAAGMRMRKASEWF